MKALENKEKFSKAKDCTVSKSLNFVHVGFSESKGPYVRKASPYLGLDKPLFKLSSPKCCYMTKRQAEPVVSLSWKSQCKISKACLPAPHLS